MEFLAAGLIVRVASRLESKRLVIGLSSVMVYDNTKHYIHILDIMKHSPL